MALVLRLLENAPIELQPGQLAIVEARRTLGRRSGAGCSAGCASRAVSFLGALMS